MRQLLLASSQLLLPLLLLLVALTTDAASVAQRRPLLDSMRRSSGINTSAEPIVETVVPYSPNVQFYSAGGLHALAYSNANQAGGAFVCRFTGRSRAAAAAAATRPSYSVALLNVADDATVSIQGRLVVLKEASSTRRLVIACTVTYSSWWRNRTIEWNILVIDPTASVSNSLVWSKPGWLSAKGALTLTSAKASPVKLENNTVTCKVAVAPRRLEFAWLTITKNGEQLRLLPGDLVFAWSEDGTQLTYEVKVTYLPDADTAQDTFECEATDPMRLSTESAPKLVVPYKAGLTRLHLVNSVTGEIINDESTVTESDFLACQADVAMPEVTYSWKVMRGGTLTPAAGRNISLTGVNLFYPICCFGENELDGKKFKNKTCANMRGNSTFNTANFFDFDGYRESPLVCGHRSTMGIVQVRFSELACNEHAWRRRNRTQDNGNQDCDTSMCQSETALAQVRRNCKKREDGCTLDANWLMEGFVKNAIKTTDAMPKECFAFEGGVTRIEVDYFCTSPTFVKFEAVNVGQSGFIQSYHLPRAGCYEIAAKGASGGNHTTNYGSQGPGTWRGGRGAEKRGRFYLQRGLTLSIVVGQHGGNSTEMSPTHRTSIEDNAGTGGGGGSFVYIGRTLYVAAGGGGGASYSRDGVAGQADENGTDSDGPNVSQRGRGGRGGSAGWTNTEAASYHGGCGAGWFSSGSRRAGPEHGGPGHGGPLSGSVPPFLGGVSGGMNAGAVGGYGGGGGGSEDNGASGGGGGYSGGGAGTHDKQAGGGGGSFCNATIARPGSCEGTAGRNFQMNGQVTIFFLGSQCNNF